MTPGPDVRPATDPLTFLARQDEAPERCELVDGVVRMLPDERATENLIKGNLVLSLRQKTRAADWRVHAGRMHLHVVAANAVLCPDLFVIERPADLRADDDARLLAVRLVVEVLSPSTAAYDRGRKFELYQQLPSLQEYLLVESDRAHVDLFRRNADGLWVLHPAGPGAAVELASVGLSITMDEVYEDVDFSLARDATA